MEIIKIKNLEKKTCEFEKTLFRVQLPVINQISGKLSAKKRIV